MPCPHKSKILECKWCKQKVCVNCIDLNKHACPEISASVAAAKSNLAIKLPKVVASKVP